VVKGKVRVRARKGGRVEEVKGGGRVKRVGW
jgi:hypothetical protein